MVDLPPPPVEWVSAGGRWWVVRIGVPVMVFVVYFAAFFVELRTDPSWAASNPLYFWPLVVLAIAVEFLLVYAFPSVRRIGLSPLYLVVDVGVSKFSYSWADVRQVTRTRVQRFRWNQVSSISQTRVSVGSGAFRTSFALSPEQGDRLAKFLRIP